MGRCQKLASSKCHRHWHAQRAVLYDEQLDLRSLEDLRDWAARGVDFVVIDSETGEDVTRILLA
jgi:polyhydroxyalkanoate synthesis regulator protein